MFIKASQMGEFASGNSPRGLFVFVSQNNFSTIKYCGQYTTFFCHVQFPLKEYANHASVQNPGLHNLLIIQSPIFLRYLFINGIKIAKDKGTN